jgi:hypothetical protein
VKEAQVLIEHWRSHYNTLRPHSALGYQPLHHKPSSLIQSISTKLHDHAISIALVQSIQQARPAQEDGRMNIYAIVPHGNLRLSQLREVVQNCLNALI